MISVKEGIIVQLPTVKKSAIFFFITLLVKLAGLIRDIVIAYYFGDTYQADAFLTAFVLVNMFILFFNNGMRNAFIPSYSKERIRGDDRAFLSTIVIGTFSISSLLSILLLLLTNLLIPLFYLDHTTLIIQLISILLVALVGVAVNSVLEAYLEANQTYAIAALSQLIVLIVMIATTYIYNQKLGVFALAYGYVIGVIMSFIYKLFYIYPKWPKKTGLKIKKVFLFYVNYIPIALTVMIGQINLAIDIYFANRFGEGVVTYLNYAKNLVHLPQALIATTVGTLIFPLVSAATAEKNKSLFIKTIRQGQNVIFFFLIPAIAGMITLLPEIIALVYQRGAFTTEATLSTARVAYFYIGSVFFYSSNTLINFGLYSLNKERKVMWVGLTSVALNGILNFILTEIIGYIGIPLASSLIGAFYAITLYNMFVKEIGTVYRRESYHVIFRILLASIIMSIIIIVIPEMPILITILIGMAVYFSLVSILRVKLG